MSDGIGAFEPLTGIYEPSAIVQLADGRFLVVEDEKDHPFALLTLASDGPQSVEVPERDEGPLHKLSDLEGLAMDPAGRIVAVTSHSRTGDGEEKKSRQKLVCFRVVGNRLVEASATTDLKTALVAAHPVLAAAAELRDVKGEGGLNIEAIEFRADGKALLVGLRSPLLDGKAIVAVVENPSAVFDSGAIPVVAAALLPLDLEGRGIRSLAHVPALNGYLVVGGPVARDAQPFALWFWTGGDDAPRRAILPGLDGFAHAEGVCAATVGGKPCLVVVSDDGDRAAGRPARYLRFDVTALRIA